VGGIDVARDCTVSGFNGYGRDCRDRISRRCNSANAAAGAAFPYFDFLGVEGVDFSEQALLAPATQGITWFDPAKAAHSRE
jgi:hypothetical protein